MTVDEWLNNNENEIFGYINTATDVYLWLDGDKVVNEDDFYDYKLGAEKEVSIKKPLLITTTIIIFLGLSIYKMK